MAAVGRPTKYDETWAPRLHESMMKGSTVEMFCLETRVSKDTFYEWVKKYPEFSDAFKSGKADAEGFYQNFIVKNFENKNLQVGAIKLFMANCFGWSDKKEQNVTLSQKDEADRAVRKATDVYL